MRLIWIHFGSHGEYVGGIACPFGTVRSLKADSLGELRSIVMTSLSDDSQRSFADELFKEFMAGQITNAIVKLERMRASLIGIAA